MFAVFLNYPVPGTPGVPGAAGKEEWGGGVGSPTISVCTLEDSDVFLPQDQGECEEERE